MSRDPANPASLRLLQAVQALTGNPESSVENINTHLLQDGALVFCTVNAAIYRFDLSSARTADGLLVIDPVAGPGQWLKQPVPSVLKGQITVPSGVLNNGQQETVTAILANVHPGDALALSPSADLPTGLGVAWSRVSAEGVVSVNMADLGAASVAAVTTTFDVWAIQSLPA